MKSRILLKALSLFVAILGIGIAGCSSDKYDYRKIPYSIAYSLKDDKSAMDAVLVAAVRHKCLPQVEKSDKVKCTSSVRKHIVVIVKLDPGNITIKPETTDGLEKRITKDEYNEWVVAFGDEIKAIPFYNSLTLPTIATDEKPKIIKGNP